MNTNTPDGRTVLAALELAGRAPSLHNSQPWRWTLAQHTVHLYADQTRRLPASDPTGRELVVSCGAALHHARTAFASLGWRTFVHRLPNPAQPQHLASVEFARLPDLAASSVELAAAIGARRTDRRPFLPSPIPHATLHRLAMAAHEQHAGLTIARTRTARRELVVAMTAVNAAQREDGAYRSELAMWAGRDLGAVDGVPASGLRATDGARRPLLARDFSAAGAGDLTAPPIDDGATLAVLSTQGDDRLDWLRAGEALSAVLLTATASGLASCTLSQIAEDPDARATARTAVLRQAGEPQLLLRLGWPATAAFPAAASPRRPLSEIVDRFPAG